MNKVRLIPWWLGCLFAGWCIFVYFFADHQWWPIFLDYPLYPFSILIEHGMAYLTDWIAPATDRGWMVFDRVTGLIYLVFGFSWYFLIGLVIRRVVGYRVQTRKVSP
jgi:hypothetical protein